jgi:hypothetical protein
MHLPEEGMTATIDEEDQRMIASRPKDIQWSSVKWFRYLPPGLCLSETVHTNLLEVFFW